MDLTTLNVLLNSILVGIILITQFVNYPLFKKIDQNFETIHIGAYTSKELIGIASAYLNSCPQYFDKKGVQLRAIAVIPRFQRKGIATKLINHILEKVKIKLNPDYIWLNSRISANQLYLSNGFNPIDKPFNIKSIGMHQRFIIIIN